MDNYEAALDRWLDEWAPKTTSEDLISALELALYRVKEEAGAE